MAKEIKQEHNSFRKRQQADGSLLGQRGADAHQEQMPQSQGQRRKVLRPRSPLTIPEATPLVILREILGERPHVPRRISGRPSSGLEALGATRGRTAPQTQQRRVGSCLVQTSSRLHGRLPRPPKLKRPHSCSGSSRSPVEAVEGTKNRPGSRMRRHLGWGKAVKGHQVTPQIPYGVADLFDVNHLSKHSKR